MTGWVTDENGALRRETKHSMLRRLRDWDYSCRCIYEITVVLADRSTRALGRLEIRDLSGRFVDVATARGLGLEPEQVAARVALSPLGEAVARCWLSIPEFYPQIELLGWRVMPDHFHGLLFVTRPLGCHLGQVIKGFKLGCNKAARVLGVLSPARILSPAILSQGTGQGAGQETGRATGRAAGLWAAGFTDKILFREGQLKKMSDYLDDNPRRLAVKALFPELFKVASEVSVALPGLSTTAVGRFSALGNRFLLRRPLAQVQVSRRFFGYKRVAKQGGGRKIARDASGEPIVEFSTADFDERRADLFAAAKHGAVLLSPCISDGERQIAREALKAGYPLITLQNKGFAKLQKPSGHYFDACAKGDLLMMAPAAWPYQPGEKKMTRFDATALNRLCQWLAGETAAEIDYKGMKPANVDACAKTAACVSGV